MHRLLMRAPKTPEVVINTQRALAPCSGKARIRAMLVWTLRAPIADCLPGNRGEFMDEVIADCICCE